MADGPKSGAKSGRARGHGRAGTAPAGRREELGQYLRALRGYALSLTHEVPAADDLVQETLLKALKALPGLPPDANLRAWLFVILRNTFLSDRRRARREVAFRDGLPPDSRLAEPPRQEGALALGELLVALRTIPRAQREALVLVGACGFSCAETARLTGVTAGTVKSRVSRARRRLLRLLHLRPGEQPGGEDPATLSVLAGTGTSPALGG